MVKKITLATVKSFVRKNAGSLHIKVRSQFDGMVDGVRPLDDSKFRPVDAAAVDTDNSQTLGIAGAWFVRDSQDYFTPYSKNGFVGYEVYNCCGEFVLAVPEGEKPWRI